MEIGEARVTLTFELATEEDAAALAALHGAVAAELTRQFGQGHWSSSATEAGVARSIRTSRVLIARDDEGVAGTLQLATKKPWAIDVTYFPPAKKALYLLSMAVRPSAQRSGVGTRMIAEARLLTQAFPADAIRLDAYDAPAGAGAFYAKCGFTEVGRATYRNVPLIYYNLALTDRAG
jgi:GNAT superfamily N-acetyltransferase